MPRYSGNDGVVLVGAAAVANVRSFDFTESAPNIDASAMGDTWVQRLAGKLSASGTITCYRDETDTLGQDALLPGAAVTLVLIPRGETAGNQTRTYPALIEEVQGSQAHDGVVEITFSWVSSAARTLGTVSA